MCKASFVCQSFALSGSVCLIGSEAVGDCDSPRVHCHSDTASCLRPCHVPAGLLVQLQLAKSQLAVASNDQRAPPPFAPYPNAKPRRFRPTMSTKHLSPVGLHGNLPKYYLPPPGPQSCLPLMLTRLRLHTTCAQAPCPSSCCCVCALHARMRLALFLAAALFASRGDRVPLRRHSPR